jgi:hypothetical protein
MNCPNNNNNNNNSILYYLCAESTATLIQFNSIQFFIIYVPSQQPQGQLQTQHRVDKSNYIMDNHDIKSKSNYRQALEEKHINAEKETN